MISGSSGKKREPGWLSAPAGGTEMQAMRESPATAEKFQGSREAGTGRAARARRKSSARSASGGGALPVPTTGRERTRSALPGRQISLQTTHFPLALSATAAAGAAPAEGMS